MFSFEDDNWFYIPLHSEQTRQDILLPKQNNDRNGHHSVTFHKGYKLFAGVRVHGEKAVLQGPGSDVQLHIPEGLHGFISGHVHTDPTPFLNHIPKSESLVSPLVEYNCSFTHDCRMGFFKIKVPHSLKDQKQLQHIRVWHGDIYKKLPFYKRNTFVVNDHYIIIQTSGFSQFICTAPGCQEICYGNPKAFIFGHITPLRYPPIKSALRIYMCSPLYDILDFEKVVLFYLLPAATKLGQGNIFIGVCQDFCSRGGLVPGGVSNFSGGLQIFFPQKILLGYTNPPPPDGQCAAGTHPTGMHSCIYLKISHIKKAVVMSNKIIAGDRF